MVQPILVLSTLLDTPELIRPLNWTMPATCRVRLHAPDPLREATRAPGVRRSVLRCRDGQRRDAALRDRTVGRPGYKGIFCQNSYRASLAEIVTSHAPKGDYIQAVYILYSGYSSTVSFAQTHSP